MLKLTKIFVDGNILKNDNSYRICDNKKPLISWAAISTNDNASQKSFNIRISTDDEVLWEKIGEENQETTYNGKDLPLFKRLNIELEICDNFGESAKICDYFFFSQVEKWNAKWITSNEDNEKRAIYFKKKINIKECPKSATILSCGIGYHSIKINGKSVDKNLLEPSVSAYDKTCYYVAKLEIEELFKVGENIVEIVTLNGWRNNDGVYLNAYPTREYKLFGKPTLSASIIIDEMCVNTDETWEYSYGEIIYNHLFEGETYDANAIKSFKNVSILEGFSPKMKAESLPPIREMKRLNGTIIRRKNEYIVDFGQNFAGVVELKLPKNLKKNDEIIIRHSETLDEDGDLFTDTLRKAYSTDKYIAKGDECDLLIYTPISVYHGFRYAKISGNIDLFDESDVHGIVMYNDIDNASYFKCGSAIVNNIQQNIINTERSNIYGILTDCPQRDERMGWLNDSTVRFEEIAYNFNIGKMFKKVILDVKDTQDMDGSITCTAPFIYGERPADPVCASYMIMSKKLYEDSGDVETLKNTYESYKSWLMCLENNSTDFIMNYSHYGDWAGPSYACGDQISDIYTDEHSGYLKDEAACSALTDGKFMSTGYLYFQAKIMSEFAGILKNTDDEKLYKKLADNIKEAFNKKWVNKETLTVSTNSQGSIAFALWLEILPKDMEKPMAEKLNQDLIDSNLMITTGNLTTRYLFDVLTKFGFVDTAWKLITNEKYPSLGFMIQNEATTVWERFELKKNDGMNSHNHPMYGAVSYWFYRYIAGVSPTSKGYKTFDVMPYVPKDLTSMTANVDTPYGEINVRWNKRYGIFHLYINVPFGTEARVVIDDKIEKVQSGYWHFKKFINKAK